MIKKLTKFIILFTILLIISCNEKGKDSFQGAILTNINGEVKITKINKSNYIITSKDEKTIKALVSKGDHIKTSTKSSVDLQFENGVSMRLSSNASIILTESLINPKKANSNIQIKLEKGRFMTKTNKLLKTEQIIISTPTLVASVRGTEFLIKPEENVLLVDNGTVEVSKSSTPEKTVAVEEGQKAENTSNKIEVNPLDEEDKKELNEMQKGLEFIDAETRSRIEEIKSSYEAEIERITKDFNQQVERNKETMSAEKNQQKKKFQDQKNRITGKEGARSAMDRIKNSE